MLRDYQEEAVEWLCRTRRGIIKCPAGGGKTRIGATAIDRVARMVKRDRLARITWLANTHEQCEQANDALAMFPGIPSLCRVRVECWQSGIYLGEEDLVVVDECHHAGAPKLAEMIEASPLARWALSATPLGTDPEKNMRMLSLFDYQMFEVKRERVVDGGHLTKARVFLHDDTDEGIDEKINAEVPKLLEERMQRCYRREFREIAQLKLKIGMAGPVEKQKLELELAQMETELAQARQDQRQRITWQLCQTFGIAGNFLRNRRIISLCGVCHDEAVLVLVGTVKHGDLLAREIPGSVVCHSGMGIKKRREAIAAFRDGKLRVMIATSLADEGLDVPRASVLILACAGRSAGKVEQRTGRVLRIFEGKERGVIHDFTDQQHPMLHGQHKSRLRLYKKLGYEIAS